MKATRKSLSKFAAVPQPAQPAAETVNVNVSDAFVQKTVKIHRADADGVVLACSAKDFGMPTDAKIDSARGPIPRLEPDVLLELSELVDDDSADSRKPGEKWLFRAVVRPDLASGHISLQDAIAKQYKSLCGRVALRKVQRFADAVDSFELEHVELSFRNQFVSRSDMLEVSLAVENRALVVGQPVFVTGFEFVVSRMRRRFKDGKSREVVNGLVTSTTHISFESLTFATTCLFCVSSELDNVMPDGRIAFDWALDSLLKEYVSMLQSRYKAAPLLRVVLFGITDAREHIISTACVLRGQDELSNLPHELKRQVNLLRIRLGERSETTLSGYRAFLPAALSNFLDAVNVALERFGKHSVNRLLHITGHSLFVVTAGKGLFCIPKVKSAELTARRVHDIGIDKCTVLCVGRPPLHAAPLFEFDGRDTELQNQRSLKADSNRLYYSQPNWIQCLYYDYDASAKDNASAATRFRLFTREMWNDKFANETGAHGKIIIAKPEADLDAKVGVVAQSVVARNSVCSRPRPQAVGARLGLGRLSGITSSGFSPGSNTGNRGLGYSRLSGVGSVPRAWHTATPARAMESRVHCVWVDGKQEAEDVQEFHALLDTDLADGFMKLTMSIDVDGYEWNPAILTDSALRNLFINSFQQNFGNGSAFVTHREKILAGSITLQPGGTLALITVPCPQITVRHEEEIVFKALDCFFVQAHSDAPDFQNFEQTCYVCTVSPLWATIFAFQPVHPYTGIAWRKSGARHRDVLTTNEAMESRWRFRYPCSTDDWDAICRCPLMPIRCPQETIVDNSLSFDRDTYSIAHSPPGLALHEMVFQRLTHCFQLVSLTASTAVLTMGHQTHRLSVENNDSRTEMIRVDASQHRGVWKAQGDSDGTHRSVVFYRWNYLLKDFESCSGHIFPDIGLTEKVMHWNDFDNNVLSRKKDMDWSLPSRNIAYAVLPLKPNEHLDSSSLFRFLDKKFSIMLSVVPEDRQEDYFSKSDLGPECDASWFALTEPFDDDPSTDAISGASAGFDVPVRMVQLAQPDDSDEIVNLHRRRFAPATDVQCPVLCRDRRMYVNVSLGTTFHPRCAYTLRASWTICTGSILSDWDSKIRVNASDFGLRVVRVPRTGFDVLGQLDLLPTARFEWKTIPAPRVRVLTSLIEELGYLPEQMPIRHGCRLFHCSGDAIVVVTRTSLSWGENPLGPTGTTSHVALYRRFVRLCCGAEVSSPRGDQRSPE